MGKPNTLLTVVLISVLVALLSACTKQDTERRPSKEKWMLVTMQAEVESIDMETREVTLKGSQGNLVTFVADKSVKRLHEVSAGDVVTAGYWTFMKAEFRDPTPEEKETPLVVLAEGGRAPEGMPPGAVVGAVVKGVITIEVIHHEEQKVTIKGPRGKHLTLPVADQALLKDMKVGEVGVMTYAEAVGISLEKVKP